MRITFELWQLITLATVLAGAYAGLMKLLLVQFERRMDGQFHAMTEHRNADAKALRDVERDYLKLLADLPEKYLRREDYIRGQTVIEAKLDAIAKDVQAVQIQGAKHER